MLEEPSSNSVKRNIFDVIKTSTTAVKCRAVSDIPTFRVKLCLAYSIIVYSLSVLDREYLGKGIPFVTQAGYRTMMYAISCFHIAAQPTQEKTAVVVIPHFLSAVTLIICCMLIIWL